MRKLKRQKKNANLQQMQLHSANAVILQVSGVWNSVLYAEISISLYAMIPALIVSPKRKGTKSWQGKRKKGISRKIQGRSHRKNFPACYSHRQVMRHKSWICDIMLHYLGRRLNNLQAGGIFFPQRLSLIHI